MPPAWTEDSIQTRSSHASLFVRSGKRSIVQFNFFEFGFQRGRRDSSKPGTRLLISMKSSILCLTDANAPPFSHSLVVETNLKAPLNLSKNGRKTFRLDEFGWNTTPLFITRRRKCEHTMITSLGLQNSGLT